MRFLCILAIAVPLFAENGLAFVPRYAVKSLRRSVSGDGPNNDPAVPGPGSLTRSSLKRRVNGEPQENIEDYEQITNGYSLNGYSDSDGYRAMLDERRIFEFKNRKAGRKQNSEKEENEDGWGDLRRKKRPLWYRALKVPVTKLFMRYKDNPQPGTLILVRHGESLWNQNKTFTGWADPDLSERGVREVEHAARLLLEGGYDIDVVFTSRLKRAIRSTWILLQEMNSVYLPVFKSWRLNERNYGALTGLCKSETAEKLGHELVQDWRGSLKSRPPALRRVDKYWPGKDRKYADLSADEIPETESLMDCMERTSPVWEEKILFELKNGKNVMVVAHANTLRGLVKLIDNIRDDDIREVAIPTGIPIIYKFDKEMNSIPPSGDRQTASQVHMKGLFLEKPGLLKEALKREQEWRTKVPGYNTEMERNKNPMTSLERSLFKLRAERELGAWAGQFFDPNEIEDDGNDGNMGKPIRLLEDELWALGMQELEEGGNYDPDCAFHPDRNAGVGLIDEEEDDDDNIRSNQDSTVVPLITTNMPCVTGMPSASVLPGFGSAPVRREPVIVIIRHGKTEHNKLGLFTGWEDVPLAKEGVEEAREAGRLLKLHGFEFDVVYTSWLSRAIETAWLVLDELDSLWLPIIKTWRLNERHYGELTGLSKQMVKQRHGSDQFMSWRRGYNTAPPQVSSFSQHYPGNDNRYTKYLVDLRFSVRESMIRSIEQGRLEVHRKLPKSESLKDCMDRTIPFFTERIVPEALDQGKRVLISSSENAIRGLLMHLCNIPEEQITGLEIPNGLPLVFDLKSKCVKLLDDGSGQDPLEKYNFGKAANYLFKPCEKEDGTPDEECDVIFPSTFTKTIELSKEDREAIEAIKGPKVKRPVAVPNEVVTASG